MGFNDVLKKSFLSGFHSAELTTTAICMALLMTAILGVYVYFVYRIVSRRGFYSKSFNISLVALAMITAAIILAVQSSVVISLGMVGALSIVRFRTAVKDPMDLVFLFWAISIGIICGAGLFEVAVLVSLSVTVVILLLSLLPVRQVPLLLVVDAAQSEIEDEILKIVKKYTKVFSVKSRNITNNGMDMIIELRLNDGGAMVREIGALKQIRRASLLSHDGEVTY